MRSIRVAVDGSRASGNALAWSVELARARGARLEVVTVLGLHGPVFVDDPRDDALDEAAWVEQRQRALLERYAVDADDVPIHFRLLRGHPTETLLAAEPVPDLLVTGTRGVGGFVGLLVGSTAHQLVDHAPCSVAVVPDSDQVPGVPKHVVVGIDGSHPSEIALDWTLRTFGRDGAVVEAVVVRDDVLLATGAMGGPGMVAVGNVAATSAADLQRMVEERVPGSAGVTTWTISEGRPARALLERAGDADLLVLGLPGYDHPTPLRLGSVAHRCLKGAPVPVVVVR